jgi:hypothetical protein
MRIFKRDGHRRYGVAGPGSYARRLFRAGLFLLTGSAFASFHGVAHAQSDVSLAIALIPGKPRSRLRPASALPGRQ